MSLFRGFVLLPVLLGLLSSAPIEQAHEKYRVINLPRLTDEVSHIESYAGHIKINDTEISAMFFWYFPPSEPNNQDSNDLIIWLNGGPGYSSMLGLFTENGPLYGRPDGKLYHNPYSWSRSAHLLYVDQPGIVGFSYMKRQFLPRDEDAVSRNFVVFLENFYKAFPHLKTKRLFLTGESYAGMYIPYITQRIFNTNSSAQGVLSGIALGNPFLDAKTQFQSIVPYLESVNFFGDDQESLASMRQTQRYCNSDLPYTNQISFGCSGIFRAFESTQAKKGLLANIADVRPVKAGTPQPRFNISEFLNNHETQKAIHVDKISDHVVWVSDSAETYKSLTPDGSAFSIHLLPDITSRIPVLIYAGDQDVGLNHLGMEWTLGNLTWRGEQGFQNSDCQSWKIPSASQPQAWKCRARNLSYLRIFGGFHYLINELASHFVPRDVPDVAVTMIEEFRNELNQSLS